LRPQRSSHELAFRARHAVKPEKTYRRILSKSPTEFLRKDRVGGGDFPKTNKISLSVFKKIDATSWQVIDLTETIKKKIIAGEPCSHSPLHFKEMSCLNIHAVEDRL
jgi:hypothetical protein